MGLRWPETRRPPVAISDYFRRIERRYGRSSEVIYPPSTLHAIPSPQPSDRRLT
jgi:hypothetical protein